jgi:hypothetical protein
LKTALLFDLWFWKPENMEFYLHVFYNLLGVAKQIYFKKLPYTCFLPYVLESMQALEPSEGP